MDVQAVTEQIKAMLGYPAVSVHTPDSTIKLNIEKAYRKHSSKILTQKTIVVPYNGGKVDLTEHKAEVVVNVTPELRSPSGHNQFNEFDVRTQEIYNGAYKSIQDIAYHRQRNGNLAYIFDSFDFEYKEPYLYVDNVPYSTDELTVDILCKEPIEEIESNWIEEYALALTKVVEGRIRSKFNGGPMEFETDGRELVDEGNNELRELEESLKNKAPMYFARRA